MGIVREKIQQNCILFTIIIRKAKSPSKPTLSTSVKRRTNNKDILLTHTHRWGDSVPMKTNRNTVVAFSSKKENEYYRWVKQLFPICTSGTNWSCPSSLSISIVWILLIIYFGFKYFTPNISPSCGLVILFITALSYKMQTILMSHPQSRTSMHSMDFFDYFCRDGLNIKNHFRST